MGFLSILVAPARRALENAGIHSLEQLSEWSEQEILKLHGLGKSSIPVLKRELEKVGLDFK
jgi:DNA-directed RNA polymerase alpha subunit